MGAGAGLPAGLPQPTVETRGPLGTPWSAGPPGEEEPLSGLVSASSRCCPVSWGICCFWVGAFTWVRLGFGRWQRRRGYGGAALPARLPPPWPLGAVQGGGQQQAWGDDGSAAPQL